MAPKLEPFVFNLDLPDELKLAIADITAQWSFLEYQLGQFIEILLQLNTEHARIVTTPMSVPQKLETIDILFEQVGIDPQLDQFYVVIKHSIGVTRLDRNKIVHGLWGSRPGSPEFHLLTFMGKKENRTHGKVSPMTPSFARQIAVGINNLNVWIRVFKESLRTGEPIPSPEKLPPLPLGAGPSPPPIPGANKKKKRRRPPPPSQA